LAFAWNKIFMTCDKMSSWTFSRTIVVRLESRLEGLAVPVLWPAEDARFVRFRARGNLGIGSPVPGSGPDRFGAAHDDKSGAEPKFVLAMSKGLVLDTVGFGVIIVSSYVEPEARLSAENEPGPFIKRLSMDP
jgi:hypothetical protein